VVSLPKDIIDEVFDNANEFSNRYSSKFVLPRLIRTTAGKLSCWADIKHSLRDENYEPRRCNVKLFEYHEGLTLFDCTNGYSNCYEPERLYCEVGKLCNHWHQFLSSQLYLLDRLKKMRGQSFPWQLATCAEHLERLVSNFYPDCSHKRRKMVDRVLRDFREIESRFRMLPVHINHGDLCGKNIIVNSSTLETFSLIDLQDLQVGAKIIDFSILALYCVLEQNFFSFQEAVRNIPRWLYLGYVQNSANLSGEEITLVPTLMKLRLCQSLLNGQLAFEADPSNEYIMITNKRGWILLDLLVNNPNYSDPNSLSSLWTS